MLRFVSWTAWHDRGHSGISLQMKKQIITALEKYGKVLITSETELPGEFRRYRYHFPPHQMHSLLAGAELLFSESASMAAEAAVLGVPSIFIDDTGRGYTRELEHKYGLLSNFGESDAEISRALIKTVELLKRDDLRKEWERRRRWMLEDREVWRFGDV